MARGKRKTHEEFVREIKEKYNGEYSILGEYVNSQTKIKVRHNSSKCNNYEWITIPNNLLRGHCCPKCAGTMKKTHEKFIQEVQAKYGDEYSVLSKYVRNNIKVKIRHNCEKCNNYEYEVRPSNILRGDGCPKCFGSIKKTTQEFKDEIKKRYGNKYTVLGEYKNARTKILIRHNCDECGNYEWMITPTHLLRNEACPKCSGTIKKTTEEFIQEIEEKCGSEYTVLGEYVNAKNKIRVKHNCDECNNYEWEVTPDNLLRGQGCPVCSSRKIVLGVNTIYDTDKWMISLGVSEEDAKKYSRCSSKKITVVCPDCGRKRKVMINNIYKHKSISCSCGDGKSYPEKFMMSILDQLEVKYEIEYSPNWIKPKRYDFYIPSLNTIIETHGRQHYDGGFKRIGGRDLKEEQINDNFKRETALKNGIKYYIQLNCSESNLEWIKNSIINSELSELFNLSKIDWNVCAEFANKNIIKEVCDYWNNKKEDENTSDLGKIFGLERAIIVSYLNKGTKLGWCKYNSKKEMRKNGLKNGFKHGKKVEIFKDNKSLGIFESCAELARQSEGLFGVEMNNSNISKVCRGKKRQYKGYTFKYIE